MSLEAKVINAVCKNKDMHVLFQDNIDELFYSYKDVWDALKSYWYKYKSIPSAEILAEKFRDFEIVDCPADTKYYLDELRNTVVKNKIKNTFLDTSKELDSLPPGQILSNLSSEILKIQRLSGNSRDIDIHDFDSASKDYELRAIQSATGGVPGILTGIDTIDSTYKTGLSGGHLVIIIGWPARSKSWLGSYICAQAWLQGYSPMIVSLEMSAEEVRDRIYTLIGAGTFLNSQFMNGDINIDDFKTWAKRELSDKPKLTIISSEDHDSITPNMIQAKIDQYRPNIVLADYQQLFDDNEHSGGEIQRNTNISRQFKKLAMSNNIPFISITAATPETVADQKKPPQLAHVRWSKSIEYDANLAIAAHKHDDSDLVEIVGLKNRYGPLFSCYLQWDIDKGIVKELYDD